MTDYDRRALIECALAAQQNAYAPYSDYPVGSALLTVDGVLFSGASVENACLPAHICGPQCAFLNAVSAGYREFVALAVVTRDGDTPCGICRQMINEFAPDMQVLLVNQRGEFEELSFAEVMARPFSSHPI